MKIYKYCNDLRFALEIRNIFSCGIYKYFYLFIPSQLHPSSFHLTIYFFLFFHGIMLLLGFLAYLTYSDVYQPKGNFSFSVEN